MVEKLWGLKAQPDTQAERVVISQLTESLTITTELSTLLWQRGVHDFEQARAFFRPELSELHDPFLMKDMDRALERLEAGMAQNEKIVIYGDYDVDGTTAVALVYGFLRKHYPHLLHYNPDRYTEGYGISKIGINWAKSQGASLIIALDCGVKSTESIAYAKTQGIDFIVCDHHEPGEILPEAVAILDPKRKDCPYPFKELTGNGVGFKLLSAFCRQRGIPQETLWEYLDLVVVSIGSDIVPIVGENRILAYHGLKKLNENPVTGLKALKDVSEFQGHMSIENVVFTLGPRINAAGRIDHAQAAVQLLLATDYEKAMDFAYKIQSHNTERKNRDSQITEEALQMIRMDNWLQHEAKSTVLFKKDWHKGVIGIVASRCIEHYYRPTVIFTATKSGYAAGSARSVSGFDLYAALEACTHLLEQFGGHTHAAGMTIETAKIPAFQQEFDQAVSDRITAAQLIPRIDIDIKLNFASISPKFYRIMKQMGPFGPQNMQPVFQSSGLILAAEPQILKEKHLKLELVEPQSGIVITALGFNMREAYYEKLMAADTLDIAYSLEENSFRGQSSLQIFLKDVKCYE